MRLPGRGGGLALPAARRTAAVHLVLEVDERLAVGVQALRAGPESVGVPAQQLVDRGHCAISIGRPKPLATRPRRSPGGGRPRPTSARRDRRRPVPLRHRGVPALDERLHGAGAGAARQRRATPGRWLPGLVAAAPSAAAWICCAAASTRPSASRVTCEPPSRRRTPLRTYPGPAGRKRARSAHWRHEHARRPPRRQPAPPRVPPVPGRLRRLRGRPEDRRLPLRQRVPGQEPDDRRHRPQAGRADHRPADLRAASPSAACCPASGSASSSG